MAKRFTIETVFDAIDRISSPMRRMAARVGRSAEKMERSIGKVNGALAKVRGSAGALGGAVAAGAAVAGAALARVIGKGATFEQTLVGAGAKFTDQIERGTPAFEELSAAAQRVGEDTEFTATQAAGALKFMAVAGEDAGTAMGTLAGFTDLATATEIELNRAADIASDSVEALGFATDDTTKKIAGYARVNDLLAATSNMANVNIEQLFESVKSGGKSVLDAGQDVEVFLAAVGAIAGVVKGSKAGKDLARIFSRMLKGSGDAAKAMKTLRVKAVDQQTGKIRDMADILKDVRKNLKRFKEGKAAALQMALFGEESKVVGGVLLQNIDKLERFTTRLRDGKIGVEDLARIMRGTALGQFRTLGSAIEAIELEIFDVIRDDVVAIAKATTDWARANKDVISAKFKTGLEFMRDNYERIIGILERVGIAMVALIVITQTLTAVQAVLAIIGATAFVVTAGTVGLVVLAIVALLAVGALLIIFWDDLVEIMAIMIETSVNGVVLAFKNIGKGWDIMIAAIKAAWKPLTKFFSGLWDEIVDTFFRGVVAVSGLINKISEKTIGVKILPEIELDQPEIRGGEDEQVFTSVLPEPIRQPPPPTPEPLVGPPLPLPEPIPPSLVAPPLPPPPIPFVGPASPSGAGSANDAPPPEVPTAVNTTNTEIIRSISESIKDMQLNINLNDPKGAVDSVETNGMDDRVKVSSSGGL